VSAARFNSRAKAQSAADEIMDGLKMPASVIGNRPYRVEVSGSVNGERQTYTLGQMDASTLVTERWWQREPWPYLSAVHDLVRVMRSLGSGFGDS
jgi:hypothetical protein